MENVPVTENRESTAGRHVQHPSAATVAKRGRKAPKAKHIGLVVLIVALSAILLFAGWFFYRSSTGANIDKSKYQAVFFTNGQVYFGKLKTLNGDYMKLTDIFYLQANDATTSDSNPQPTTTDDQPDVQLIKLGSEIHGPQDEMIISRDQILFFENLKDDGTVTRSIEKTNNPQ